MNLKLGRKATLIAAGIAKAAVDAAAAQLAAAGRDRERALSDVAGIGKLRAQARLVSPVDGVVSARLVEPGTTIGLDRQEGVWQCADGRVAFRPVKVGITTLTSRPMTSEPAARLASVRQRGMETCWCHHLMTTDVPV